MKANVVHVNMAIDVADLLLNVGQAAKYLHVARSTFYKLAKSDSTFPKVMYLSSNMPRYRKNELDAWLNARKK